MGSLVLGLDLIVSTKGIPSMMYALRSLRTISIVFLMGTGTGAYLLYEYYAAPMLSLVKRGYCGNEDVTHSLWWSACRDSYIAMEIQQREAERDSETLTILNSMEGNQPKRSAKMTRVKQ